MLFRSKDIKGKFLHSEREVKLFETHFISDSVRLFKGKGCDKCGNTGYRGRMVVAEVLELNTQLRDLIAKKADQASIEKAATEKGMIPMLEDGLGKVISGSTTLDELFRVLNQ